MKNSLYLSLGIRPGFTALATAFAYAAASPALAQGTAQTDQAPDYQNKEIVVTARSTGETLTEVPVAVTALSGEDIERYASADLVKMSQLTPQVEVYGSGAGSGGAFLVRGIGTTADTAGVDQSVSISLDGSQIARPRTAVASMFDLEQVAILKGPQALFFGKNSSAGVIQLQTANPTSELSGYVTGGYEFKARERYVNAAISIPLTDTLGVRFAGRFTKMRGYVENLGQSKIDPIGPNFIGIPGVFAPVTLQAPHHRWGPGTEEIAGRITIKWEPTSNYTSIMKATFNKLTDNGGTSTTEPVCAGTHPTHLGFPDLNSECKLNGIRHVTDLPALYAVGPFSDSRWFDGVPFTDSRSKYFTWQQNLDLGPVLITANTGYSTLKFATRGPYSSTEFAEFSGGVTEDYKGFSQEVRLITQLDGPFNATVGGYYEKTKTNVTSALFLYNFGPDDFGPTPTGSYQSGTGEATARSRAWSVFGQARWDITPDIELAAGARYTKTRKTAIQGQPRYVHYAASFLLPEGTTLNSRLNEDNWSPEATITWHPTPDSTLYAAYKTGYKSGGIALPTVVTAADTAEGVVFRPEKAKGGEIGYKANLMGRRLRVGLTAYYYKFSGLQLTSYDPVTSAYKIQNAADAKQKGIEGEVEFSVTPELTLRAAASYNSVKYGKFLDSSCYANQTAAEGCYDANLLVDGADADADPTNDLDVQDLSGRRLHRAPKFSASAGFSYDTLVGTGFMIGLNGDIRYTSSAYALETQSPISKQKSYALVNAGVRVYAEDKTWELAVIGRNLTNKRLIGFIQDKPGAVIPGVNEANIYGTRPREIAVQGTVRF